MKKAIIIGSGIGGLASALRMRHKGYEVEVIEQNGYPGGKLTELRADGYRWDAGPSLFTMPHLVTELIELFGRDVNEYFSYNRQEEVCRYWWEDGMTFTVDADPSTFINDAASTFSIDPSRLHQYLKDSRFKYDHTSPLFLERSLHKASTYLSKDTLKALVNVGRMDLSKSLHDYNLQMLEEPHLVQLFDRYATYNGSSPYQTPGIMSMIPHLEMDIGTYFPEGGMHSITQALYNLAVDVGIAFRWNHAVDQIIIENRKAKGVRIKNEILKADVVISNMDIHPTYNKLLSDVSPPRNTLTQERSSSALIFYWGVKGIHEHFGLHNILFSGQYRSEFESLFDRYEIGDDPTVYINITSKIESVDAPPGNENWFVMINAPGDYGQRWDELILQARAKIIDKIERLTGRPLSEHIVTERVLDPRSIASKTSSHQGALYGSSSNDRMAAFLRHPNFHRRIPNLFFCGGSVHPGGGIPLCLLSGKIVSELAPTP